MVSIPHRYDYDKFACLIEYDLPVVSIPHRYDYDADKTDSISSL